MKRLFVPEEIDFDLSSLKYQGEPNGDMVLLYALGGKVCRQESFGSDFEVLTKEGDVVNDFCVHEDDLYYARGTKIIKNFDFNAWGERDGPVLGLCSYDGLLYDSGMYKRVYLTNSGLPMFDSPNPDWSVPNLVNYSGNLMMSALDTLYCSSDGKEYRQLLQENCEVIQSMCAYEYGCLGDGLYYTFRKGDYSYLSKLGRGHFRDVKSEYYTVFDHLGVLYTVNEAGQVWDVFEDEMVDELDMFPSAIKSVPKKLVEDKLK